MSHVPDGDMIANGARTTATRPRGREPPAHARRAESRWPATDITGISASGTSFKSVAAARSPT